MREVQQQIIRGKDREIRDRRPDANARQIRNFGERNRELCPQDFLGPEALKCFERSNRRVQ